MKIAINSSDGRVCPVFGSSRAFLVVDLVDGQEVSRQTYDQIGESVAQQILWLEKNEIDVVICGAIMNSMTEMLRAAGIGVLDRVRGSVDVVLQQYRTQTII